MPSKAAELRDLTDEQLLERVESAKEELFNLRFQLATGQLDNPSMIRKVRHEIARIATVMREREIEMELDAALAGAEAGVEDEEGTERQ
jgi:large subunit ribosomal protein L29